MTAHPVHIPAHLRGVVRELFTPLCKVCGAAARVADGVTVPHRCQIEVS